MINEKLLEVIKYWVNDLGRYTSMDLSDDDVSVKETTAHIILNQLIEILEEDNL